MTLIDKAVLLNRIATEVHYDSEHSLEMYAKLLSEINDAPDALIRCKDCIHYGKSIGGIECQGYCKKTEYMTKKDDDFCSWGERREDADKLKAYLQKNSVNHTLADIDAQPTVDAVEVVRCRDCKQFVQTNAIHDGECPKLQLFVNKDYYCWWGERREDERQTD